MRVDVQPVRSHRDLDSFIQFPLGHYDGHPHYVPALTRERRRFFDPRRNPQFAHIRATQFLARDEVGRIVGRISAHRDQRLTDSEGEAIGGFGFFESTRNDDVARALFQAGEGWHREQGVSRIRGPLNFSTNDECGLLVEGFDRDPALMMPYTHDYYPGLVMANGYRPVKDLLAYELTAEGIQAEQLERADRHLDTRGGFSIRPMNLRRFKAEAVRAFALYNVAWERNWGFVPMAEDEFHYLANQLKPFIVPGLALLAEAGDRVVGFILAVPDINPLLKDARGRMGFLGALRFQRGLRHLRAMRVIALGVHPDFRKRGVEGRLMMQGLRNGIELGFERAEMSWILEDNVLMNRAIRRVGGELTKRYQIFEKEL